MPDRARSWGAYRDLVTLVVSALCIVAFAHFTSGAETLLASRRIPLLGGLGGDLPGYVWRFALSLLLLGVAPAASAMLTGERPASIGLRAPRALGRPWVWGAVAAVAIAAAWIGAHDPEMAAYYPYSKTLVDEIRVRGPAVFGLHAAIYLVLYYLPWELLFRGILVFPVLRLAPAAGPAGLLALASLQAIPSALLHIGHPVIESLAAVFFGVGAGWLALRSGSILPGLAIHAGIGILQDLFIVLRNLGQLP